MKLTDLTEANIQTIMLALRVAAEQFDKDADDTMVIARRNMGDESFIRIVKQFNRQAQKARDLVTKLENM
jgi:hypothetical protein